MENPINKMELVFAYQNGAADEAILTLQRITLYRLGAMLTGIARRSNDAGLVSKLETAREMMLDGQSYEAAYSRVMDVHRSIKSYSVYGIGSRGQEELELNNTGDVLLAVSPESRTGKLSLMMGKRFLRYNTLDPGLIDVDRSPTPLGGVGYLETWTRHPAQIERIIKTGHEHFGKVDPAAIIVRNAHIPPITYFKANNDPHEGMDPVYLAFIGQITPSAALRDAGLPSASQRR